MSGIAQEIVELDLAARSFTFTFNGPITVEIQGSNQTVDADNPFTPGVSAALTVNKLQDLFFRGRFRSDSNTPLFPYLGYTQDSQGTVQVGETINVEFTQFVGFFDANNSGDIDPLSQFGSSNSAFRGLSITGQESQSFGFTEGPDFPLQLFSNPQLGQTNGVIFAGAIAMNGQPLPTGLRMARGRLEPRSQQRNLPGPPRLDSIRSSRQ